jgi:hypothetical protein
LVDLVALLGAGSSPASLISFIAAPALYGRNPARNAHTFEFLSAFGMSTAPPFYCHFHFIFKFEAIQYSGNFIAATVQTRRNGAGPAYEGITTIASSHLETFHGKSGENCRRAMEMYSHAHFQAV